MGDENSELMAVHARGAYLPAIGPCTLDNVQYNNFVIQLLEKFNDLIKIDTNPGGSRQRRCWKGIDLARGLPVRGHSGMALASRSVILQRFNEIVAYIYPKRENSCKVFGLSTDSVIILQGSSYQPRVCGPCNR